MGARKIRIKKGLKLDIETRPQTMQWKVNEHGKMAGRHYDIIAHDDIIEVADQHYHIKMQDIMNLRLDIIMNSFRTFFAQWESVREGLTKEELTKQVELYRNVIETKYGVKLCIKENLNSDMTTMELLVPNKLFADAKGKESLADALQNIAMFIMSLGE